ncbi:universal stress protein [uncultured Friedmanniella sp.]|uniref:universal stress protein n=1 Tax=uncultured Friedmanniella sp. TaxID=335381 RepID=UPI0035CBAFE8
MGETRVAAVVLGITPRQPPEVLAAALGLASRSGGVVVCAYVDAGSYVVEEHADGSVDARPIDPDQFDWTSDTFDPDLARRVRAAGAAQGVEVQLRALAGDVGKALARLAETVDAEAIVVGSRRGGVRASMHDFFGGSVAVHLIHRQPRPVLVVPVEPSPPGMSLPWEEVS